MLKEKREAEEKAKQDEAAEIRKEFFVYGESSDDDDPSVHA